MREITYAQAGAEALAEEMRRDPKTFEMSTDADPALLEEFGGLIEADTTGRTHVTDRKQLTRVVAADLRHIAPATPIVSSASVSTASRQE